MVHQFRGSTRLLKQSFGQQMPHTSAEWSGGCIQHLMYTAPPQAFNMLVALICEASQVDVKSGQLSMLVSRMNLQELQALT